MIDRGDLMKRIVRYLDGEGCGDVGFWGGDFKKGDKTYWSTCIKIINNNLFLEK